MTERVASTRLETLLVHAGRDPARSEGAVNPAVHRASTLLIPNVDELYAGTRKTYALEGMAVQESLRAALAAIEGGVDAVLAPSGLGACTLALLSVARAGGEILVTDSVYGPTRQFCDTMLRRLGVSARYFPPRIGADISTWINDKTCALFLESPGSCTFEVQDVPALSAQARRHGVPVILDNTWSAGVHFKPFDYGVDLSVQSLTKHQAGHADVLLGAVVAATREWADSVRTTYKMLGLGASPDDAYLVLRGLRTMSVRLDRQGATALQIARWLEQRPEVAQVLHPALASHPDHELWRRDFSGASSVFGVVLKPCAREGLRSMLEGYRFFGMGFSWGAFESLVIPTDGYVKRVAQPWCAAGPLLRFSVGLEHEQDLLADLEEGFLRLHRSSAC